TMFFFTSRRRHTRCLSDWSSDVCSSDLTRGLLGLGHSLASHGGHMKTKWLVMGAAGIGILLGASGAAAQSYNPLKWIKKNPGPTANEQLAANQEEERKLSLQLQALLPPKTTLREACNGLLSLEDCV